MSWWNPGGLWHWITSGWDAVVSGTKWFVFEVVHAAIDMVEQDITDIEDIAKSGFDDVWSSLDTAWTLAQEAYDKADNAITSAIPAAERDIHNWAEDVIRPIDSAAHAALNTADDIVKVTIPTAIKDVQNWAERYIHDAVQGIEDIPHLIQQGINDVWQPIYRDAIKPIEGDIASAGQQLSDLWHWVETDAKPAIAMVKANWSALVWMSNHTLADLEQITATPSNPIDYLTALGEIGKFAGDFAPMVDSAIAEISQG